MAGQAELSTCIQVTNLFPLWVQLASKNSNITRGGSRREGGGAWGAHAPPPSRLSKRKMWRFTVRLVHIATPTQRTSLCKPLLHVLNQESQETVLWQCLKHKGWFRMEGALRNYHMMNRLNYTLVATNFAWLWWSLMASEAISHSLNFKTFLGEHAPDPPTRLTALFTHGQLRAARATPIPTRLCMYAPTSLISGSAPDHTPSGRKNSRGKKLKAT